MILIILFIIVVTILKFSCFSYLPFVPLCKTSTMYVSHVQSFYVVHLTLPEQNHSLFWCLLSQFLWWCFSLMIQRIQARIWNSFIFPPANLFFTCKSIQLIFLPIIIKDRVLLKFCSLNFIPGPSSLSLF